MSKPVLRSYYRLTRYFGLHATAERPCESSVRTRIFYPKSAKMSVKSVLDMYTRFLYTRPSKKLLKRGRYAAQ